MMEKCYQNNSKNTNSVLDSVIDDIKYLETRILNSSSKYQKDKLIKDYISIKESFGYLLDYDQMEKFYKDNLIKNKLRFLNKRSDNYLDISNYVYELNKIIENDKEKYRSTWESSNNYTSDELLEIVSDFTMKEPMLKEAFDKVLTDRHLHLADTNHSLPFSGICVCFYDKKLKPYIIVQNHQKLFTAGILVHELGHYLENLKKDNSRTSLDTAEITALIFHQKFINYCDDKFADDETFVQKYIQNRLILTLLTYQYQYEKDKSKEISNYYRFCNPFVFSVAYLTSLAKDFTDQEINNYFNEKSINLDNNLRALGLQKEQLYNEKILKKTFEYRTKK